MLKFKKVYIDSYYKVSRTASNFTIDLPETVQLEENMLCQIHEVSIPHAPTIIYILDIRLSRQGS